MKNKIVVLIVLILLLITGIIIFVTRNNKDNNKNADNDNYIIDNNNIQNTEIVSNSISENNIRNEIKESEEIVDNTIKITINNKNYNATLEQNETAKQFFNMLPQEFSMNELNGNEKYVYLDNTLTTNPYNPKHIEAGDIMLYGNNCLVVFYKSFDTQYSYTKIGHIENFDDLGNKNITIKFEK